MTLQYEITYIDAVKLTNDVGEYIIIRADVDVDIKPVRKSGDNLFRLYFNKEASLEYSNEDIVHTSADFDYHWSFQELEYIEYTLEE